MSADGIEHVKPAPQPDKTPPQGAEDEALPPDRPEAAAPPYDEALPPEGETLPPDGPEAAAPRDDKLLPADDEAPPTGAEDGEGRFMSQGEGERNEVEHGSGLFSDAAQEGAGGRQTGEGEADQAAADDQVAGEPMAWMDGTMRAMIG
jgi:hypothetical protein